ncbi:hypothetical protein [uncultured Pseudoteredinibacter sp.]|uniref:hypothetical protein n=1 Tax=uncultured Pseudoteredinibacter sp. TaxID=1641701 RepID=UPI0026237BEB|nr:hypothetical protein [uncultured Pseudoteredinibacter sp.]
MLHLKEPWNIPVNSDALETELDRELHPSSHLYKFKGQFKAVAKNESNDDVIFEVREMGYALVHLTWSKNDPSVNYPRCKMLAKVKDAQAVIDSDHEFN